jgi:zinc-binding in reverse transcriptase
MVKKQFRDLQSVFCIQLPSNAPVAQLNHIKHLGGIKGPLRVRTFAWVASHGRILTTDNLRKGGWPLTNICYMCRNQEETIKH